jgi:hypothetical protein
VREPARNRRHLSSRRAEIEGTADRVREESLFIIWHR